MKGWRLLLLQVWVTCNSAGRRSDVTSAMSSFKRDKAVIPSVRSPLVFPSEKKKVNQCGSVLGRIQLCGAARSKATEGLSPRHAGEILFARLEPTTADGAPARFRPMHSPLSFTYLASLFTNSIDCLLTLSEQPGRRRRKYRKQPPWTYKLRHATPT